VESVSVSPTPTATNGVAAARPARRLTEGRLLIVALAIVLFVQGLFVTSYVGALHNPQPHKVPFGVAGSSKLAAVVGKQFSLRTKTYADESAARRAIDRRTIYGALITNPSATTLLVAPAASNGVATALTTAFTKVAAATGQKLTVVQVHRLPDGDRVGIVPFLVAMALVIGGYLSATMATTIGATITVRRRAPILAGVAVIGALVTSLLAGPLLGAIPTGHFLELWGIFTFLMLAVVFAAAALQTVFGAIGTLIVIVVFVIFGAPAAGGSLARPFLPSFWGTIGPYLPPGAGTTAIRNTIYFGGNGIGQALLVLAAYLVAGAAIVLRGRRPSTPQPPEAVTDIETAGAAAAVI
jgi:hypothetical protein